MLEALWSVEFISNLQNMGAGVAIFETGRVFGGDSQYYYLGRVRIESSIVHADVRVTHFFGTMNSIFGSLKTFNLKLSGEIKTPVMELKGTLVENPNLNIFVRLTKLEDLP